MTVQLEAIETTPEEPYRDPLDSTGFRCNAEHNDVGKCHRKASHVRADEWHHTMTDDGFGHQQFWRWRDVEGP